MTEKTNLAELISKSDEAISWYLSEVPISVFKEDLKDLIRDVSDKKPIKDAINKLQELL